MSERDSSTILGTSPTVTQLGLRLQRLACDVDEVIAQLDEEMLNLPDAIWLTLPHSHLSLAIARLGQALYEANKLDDAPRRQRLRLVEDEEQAA